MPEPAPLPSPSVLQLRVVLAGVSPLIWRRLLVDAGTALDQLHKVLQGAFSWQDIHLYRFKVHGTEFDDIDCPRVRLAELGLRPTERFVYDYDFTAGWRHDIRVEQIVAVRPGWVYPRCTGGRRAGPPEDSGGPWAFMERTQPHCLWAVATRATEIVTEILEDSAAGEDFYEELACLRPWLGTERFDRRALNLALAGLDDPKERAA